jgi:hypothetical protein
MRSSEAMNAWRRVCSTTPLRASIRMMARFAVDAPGDHVPRVLDVPGRVGDDELAPGGREVPVGDVDRDALLALGPQAIGEQRQVHVLFAAQLARALDRVVLVVEDRLAVVEQSADQGRLAVVDAPRRGEAQKLHVEIARRRRRAVGRAGDAGRHRCQK